MNKDGINAKMFAISETSILVEFGNEINKYIQRKVKAFADYLDKNPIKGMIEYIPAFTSVTVNYDPMEVKNSYKKHDKFAYKIVEDEISEILNNIVVVSDDNCRIVKIPVCYGGKLGPDLDYVASYNKISIEEVIKIHSEGEYLVYMIGFAPGFPYLGGMSEEISTPRRKSPRTAIPKGSVGIAGMQTGVYPISTPGGWQLIGRTPLELFRPKDNPPSLLRAGDVVKFVPISYEEYRAYEEGEI
ncbi:MULTISPECIES: 5-oxoprolinase subunit PxpB [Clostridium]|uniref:5-oxoprolinase subunit PxpB n=1 Tax=Clostridium TaxID=1485 RepID=UPI00069F4D3D|nr:MULTISPECIES: 5-oxoprolinase subunit PxpB [Clostridium]KOF57108.1 kinase inhibitor [Clostridium sp. DMHC 10]MCD2348689.1 5-oxoprolinase subunit PxpB [Clostridium guangxiense]